MILQIYSLYNRLVGCYNSPTFEKVEPKDKVEDMQRFIKLTDDLKLKRLLLESDLYHLGSFDDHDGSFTLSNKPEFLCSFQEEKKDVQN